MNEYALQDVPSPLRLLTTLLGCALLAAFQIPLLEYAVENLPKALIADPKQALYGIFLIETLFLCLFAFGSSGFMLGDARNWKRNAIPIALVWIMPPLLTFIVMPFTNKPFQGEPYAFWLLGAAAQELLFTGFVYGRMESIFGKPAQGPRGAFSAAVWVTAFLFALSHWPYLRLTEEMRVKGWSHSYVAFLLAYSFVGCAWLLNIRRWTGCVWPAVLNHVLVNLIARSI